MNVYEGLDTYRLLRWTGWRGLTTNHLTFSLKIFIFPIRLRSVSIRTRRKLPSSGVEIFRETPTIFTTLVPEVCVVCCRKRETDDVVTVSLENFRLELGRWRQNFREVTEKSRMSCYGFERNHTGFPENRHRMEERYVWVGTDHWFTSSEMCRVKETTYRKRGNQS